MVYELHYNIGLNNIDSVSFRFLVRLIMSVWKWDYFLTRIKNEFNKLNELHSMILNGKLIHNDARTAKECVSGENEVKNLYKQTEARITHELLLHLLVSLEQ